jgi:antitoxin (DNA-binding transcriptional repressor) of toxin-antitoxin stability system
MASSVGLREAQEYLGELLDRVERGEEIVIERDGRGEQDSGYICRAGLR